ncbi:MAG: TRAP transporter substrate-binding protein [Sphaerochaetaceae bacterium]|nr:TRAP transporter substrate-binding protein [Sphaerochaetaceae bacterium]
MKKLLVLLLVLIMSAGFVFANGQEEAAADEKPVFHWKYAHMNAEANQSGQMAIWFCERLEELTDGGIQTKIYPNSQLGSMIEQLEMVATGTVQFHHDTWGNLGSLVDELQAFDTPYLAKSVEDYVKLNSPESPIFQEANEKFINQAGVRLLGSTYGGARCLTCNFPIYSPDDLKGVKIRAIPAPIYVTAVEGMGAIAVPVDWVDVPAALSTGVVEGQENPPSTMYAVRMQDMQKYMMDTKHIAAIGPMMVNEEAFQSLPADYQEAVLQAGRETAEKFTEQGIREEQEIIQKLIDEGMTFITAEDGLDVDAFKASVDKKVAENFPQYADFYAEVKEYLGY